MGVVHEPAQRQLRFLHGTHGHDQLLSRWEWSPVASQIQLDGEDVAALWTTARKTRGLVFNVFHLSFKQMIRVWGDRRAELNILYCSKFGENGGSSYCAEILTEEWRTEWKNIGKIKKIGPISEDIFFYSDCILEQVKNYIHVWW